MSVSLFQTLKHGDRGGGGVDFVNCPESCSWPDNYLGYSSTQIWGNQLVVGDPIGTAVAGVNPAADGTTIELGSPFLMTHFGHYNGPYNGQFSAPSLLGIQTRLTLQRSGGSPAVFSMLGPSSVRLEFDETDDRAFACDPDIQVSQTKCDDLWRLPARTATTTADGVTWHFTLLGWGQPDGTFTTDFASEERKVPDDVVPNTKDIYGQVTIDTNATTSVLTVSDAGALTMTVTPRPQTGGTVDFTDGGNAVPGCSEVPVDTATGVAACAPDLAPGAHTFGGDFNGSFGYAASTAADVGWSDLEPQAITFDGPTGVRYGDAGIPLGATASSGLPVSYSAVPSGVCTVTGATLNVLAAGSCTVTASQAGNDTYAAATPVERTITIGTATLTVTADDKSRQVGTANPPLTATITGFVNGDSSTGVSGTPGLSTTAVAASPPGSYPITVSTAGLSAANYDFTGVNGTLTVVPADLFAACQPGAPVPPGYRLITGTSRGDLLLGTPAKELIRAGAGNDLVAGGGGDDILCGGSGNDLLNGGSGADLIDGGSGLDLLSGGSGHDRGRDADLLTLRFSIEDFTRA